MFTLEKENFIDNLEYDETGELYPISLQNDVARLVDQYYSIALLKTRKLQCDHGHYQVS